MRNSLRSPKNLQPRVNGLEDVEVILRRSDRARRLSLRVSRLDGRVTLTAPPYVPQPEVDAFLEDRADWVRQHLADCPKQVLVGPGTRLPVLGQALFVTPDRVRGPKREADRLLVAEGREGAHAAAFLKTTARTYLSHRCDGFAQTLGRRYTQLDLRDTRSRWGSCSTSGRLMFSWRLALAPQRINDYVAAHEVAHLVEMNHSSAFWDVVAALHPSWDKDRRWLRENGAWLHRYRFDGGQT